MALDLGTLTGYLELDDKKVESVLSNLPGKLELSGTAMKLVAGGIALAVGAALVGGITNAIDLQDANAKITASLGLTEAESARIGGVAGKLYSDAYGQSIDEVNTAVESVVGSFDGMRQASGEAIEATTAKLLNLQTAMGIDVARSAQVAGQAVKNGLAGSADEAIDLLTANLQRVPAAVRDDLIDAVDEYGPILANMGFSGEEAFGMLANAADKGMYGIDKTGDALKELSIRASDMSTASVAAYGAAGLNAEEMARKMQLGGAEARDATEQIIQGLLGIKDPVAQSNAAIALFGTPLEDLGTQEIPTFLDSLGQVKDGFKDTAGAADEMGATLNGTASVGWTQLSRTWDSIIGQVGGALLPILSEVITFLNENPAVLQIVATAVGILAAAFIGLTVATWAMNTALLANPITWIILAIVALVAAIVLLIANWDTVVKFLADAWAGFIGWFTGVMDGFLSWWGGIWDGLMSGIAEGWEAVLAWFAGIPGAIGAFFAGVGQWLLDVGRMLLEGLAAGIALGFLAVWYFFTQFPIDVLNFLVGAGVWLVQAGLDLLAGLGAGIVAGWEFLVAWFQALPGMILSFLMAAGAWLLATGTQLIDGLRNGIVNGWNAVVAWFQALPGVVLNFLAAAGTWLLVSGQNLITGIRTGIVNGWNGVVSWFQGLPGQIMGFFSGAGQWLWNIGRDMINGLLNGIRSLGSTIGNFFLDLLPDWIVGPFKAALGIHSPSTVFAEFGRNIVQGIPVGMDDEQSALDRRVRDLVNVPDGSALSGGAAAAFGREIGVQGVTRVSLDGARLLLEVDGREIVAIIREQIVDASEERRGELVDGTGEVVFA